MRKVLFILSLALLGRGTEALQASCDSSCLEGQCSGFSRLIGSPDLALVLIDLQREFYVRASSHGDKENQRLYRFYIRRINYLLISAIREKRLVLFVTYEGHGPIESDVERILEEEGAEEGSVFHIEKNAAGLFMKENRSSEEAHELLQQHHIKKLLVAGANGEACVRASIFSALDTGYTVYTCPNAVISMSHERFIYPYNVQLLEKKYRDFYPHTCNCLDPFNGENELEPRGDPLANFAKVIEKALDKKDGVFRKYHKK